MKNFCFVLFIFLSINNLSGFMNAQSIDKKYYTFLHKAKTPDLLYINDSIAYLMDKSPLKTFSGYKDLYSSYKKITIVELNMDFGTQIHPFNNTTYQLMWCLRDSMLYLSDIKFYSLDVCDYKVIFPNNEQYKLLERLTGVKFDKTKPPLSNNPFRHRNKIGMMPASWSNDTILIKRARKLSIEDIDEWTKIPCEEVNDTILIRRTRKSLLEDVDKWIKTPCEELIFKNGKLISRETKDIY